MYFLLGMEECLATLRMLTGLEDEGDPNAIAKPIRLKAGYLAWLRRRQDSITTDALGSRPDFVEDPEVEAELLRGLLGGGGAADPRITPISETLLHDLMERRDAAAIHRKLGLLKDAVALLPELDPQLWALFGLIVNRIFVAELAGEPGGSSPLMTGVIWANPGERAGALDLAELLVRELARHLLFLDETLHKHFRVRRPLAAVLEGLVTSLEIVALRRLFDAPSPEVLHPPSDAILEGCADAIYSTIAVDGWQDQLRPRGRHLFEACRHRWQTLARSAPESHGAPFDPC